MHKRENNLAQTVQLIMTKLEKYDYIHESVNNMEYTGCTYRIIQMNKIGFESTNSD